MAMYIFTKKILSGKPIQVFNNGDMRRDFTYIDDIVKGVIGCLDNPPDSNGSPPCKVYNIGNHKSEGLMEMIGVIEKALGMKAEMELLPLKAGDFKETFADNSAAKRDFDFVPETTIEEGIPLFVDWFRQYHFL